MVTENYFNSLRLSRHARFVANSSGAAAGILVFASVLVGWGQTLGEAVNATNLTWTTSGSGANAWTVQSATTHDGVSAAKSGLVSLSSQTSTLQTTVAGPGKLEFFWYSSDSDFSTLSFTVDGVTQTNISSWGLWRKETFFLLSGNHTLRWINSGSTGSGYGYLDEVTYTPGEFAPEITVQPLGQSQVPGMDTVFTVMANGTPPLAYQWRLNETNLFGATSSVLIVSNTQAANLGNYAVVISNSVAPIVSTNAPLGFGQVTAWGRYQSGETAVPFGLTNVLGIFAGESLNSIALTSDQNLAGWGMQGIYGPGPTPVPTNLSNVLSVAVGGYKGVALDDHGNVSAWGQNFYSQTNVPTGLANVVAISTGYAHSLALQSDGTVVAWGGNYYGQTNVPAGLSNVVAIAAGYNFSLALKSDGSVKAWGNFNPISVASFPSSITNVIAIAAGRSHLLALRSDGSLFVGGSTPYDLGNIPAGLSNVVAISAGQYHNLALKTNGVVIAWGNNSYGQTNVPLNLTNVNAIAGGSYFSLALVGSGPPISGAMMMSPELSTNGFRVSLPSQCGRVYRLEYKMSPGDPEWLALPLVAGTGKDLILTDSTAVASQRFYRVRRW